MNSQITYSVDSFYLYGSLYAIGVAVLIAIIIVGYYLLVVKRNRREALTNEIEQIRLRKKRERELRIETLKKIEEEIKKTNIAKPEQKKTSQPPFSGSTVVSTPPYLGFKEIVSSPPYTGVEETDWGMIYYPDLTRQGFPEFNAWSRLERVKKQNEELAKKFAVLSGLDTRSYMYSVLHSSVSDLNKRYSPELYILSIAFSNYLQQLKEESKEERDNPDQLFTK